MASARQVKPLPRLADATLNVLSDCWYWLRRGWATIGRYA